MTQYNVPTEISPQDCGDCFFIDYCNGCDCDTCNCDQDEDRNPNTGAC